MFSLTTEQVKKASDWCKKQDAKLALLQKLETPNYGANGGAYTYEFTPTTLGLVTKVRNNLTKDEIDLTDYEEW